MYLWFWFGVRSIRLFVNLFYIISFHRLLLIFVFLFLIFYFLIACCCCCCFCCFSEPICLFRSTVCLDATLYSTWITNCFIPTHINTICSYDHIRKHAQIPRNDFVWTRTYRLQTHKRPLNCWPSLFPFFHFFVELSVSTFVFFRLRAVIWLLLLLLCLLSFFGLLYVRFVRIRIRIICFFFFFEKLKIFLLFKICGCMYACRGVELSRQLYIYSVVTCYCYCSIRRNACFSLNVEEGKEEKGTEVKENWKK